MDTLWTNFDKSHFLGKIRFFLKPDIHIRWLKKCEKLTSVMDMFSFIKRYLKTRWSKKCPRLRLVPRYLLVVLGSQITTIVDIKCVELEKIEKYFQLYNSTQVYNQIARRLNNKIRSTVQIDSSISSLYVFNVNIIIGRIIWKHL